MSAVNPDASQQAVVEAALVLLERMGLSRRTCPPSRSHASRIAPVAHAMAGEVRDAVASQCGQHAFVCGVGSLERPGAG